MMNKHAYIDHAAITVTDIEWHGDAMTVAGKEYWEAVFSFLDDCLGALSISR